jgi:hypothetical protein
VKRPSASASCAPRKRARPGPRELEALAQARTESPRGVIVGGVPCSLVPDSSGAAAMAAVLHQTLHLVRPDRATGGVRADRVGVKLSSRAGAERRRHQRSVRLVRTPRQTGGAGRRKPAGPWPVRPRLVERDVPAEASALAGGSGSQGRDRRRAPITRIRWSAWRMASTPSGGSPPSPAQAGRAAPSSLERGSVDPVVVLVDCYWLQKSTRVTWSKPATAPGNRRGGRWV